MSCPQFLGMVVESCTVTCTGMELCHLPHPDLLSFGWGNLKTLVGPRRQRVLFCAAKHAVPKEPRCLGLCCQATLVC